MDSLQINGKILCAKCGRRQVVRHQPSKLIFVGSSPIARSGRARSSAAERAA